MMHKSDIEIPMDDTLAHIIAQVPGWAEAENLTVKPAGGLTNTNFLATVRGERFMLRVSGGNTSLLGIDRELELEALTAASSAGIGPEIVCFMLPEGHLVTRLIAGRHLSVAEYHRPQNLRRVVETVKHLHNLPAIRATFSPFRRVEAYTRKAREFGVPFPEDFPAFVERMHAIEAQQQRDPGPWLRFCHNDLFSVNVLDDGAIRIIDWEFAGMGDIYFDLATLVYAYDSDGPLSPEEEVYLLECYFGNASPARQARLAGMEFMLLFFTAMWGMLQHGIQRAGIMPPFEGFDCLDYAQETFAAMRNIVPH